MENTIMTLKSYNENDVYEIAVYDYRLLCNSDEYCNHEEIQRFYTPSQYNDLQFLEIHQPKLLINSEPLILPQIKYILQ